MESRDGQRWGDAPLVPPTLPTAPMPEPRLDRGDLLVAVVLFLAAAATVLLTAPFWGQTPNGAVLSLVVAGILAAAGGVILGRVRYARIVIGLGSLAASAASFWTLYRLVLVHGTTGPGGTTSLLVTTSEAAQVALVFVLAYGGGAVALLMGACGVVRLVRSRGCPRRRKGAKGLGAPSAQGGCDGG